MSRNYFGRTAVIVSLLSLALQGLWGGAPQYGSSEASDDALMISAIVLTQEKRYEEARKLYAELYKRTRAPLFLFREAAVALMHPASLEKTAQKLANYLSSHPDDTEALRLAVPIYLTLHKRTEALQAARKLGALSTAPADVTLAVQPLLYEGKNDEAEALLASAYKRTGDETLLMRLVSVMELDPAKRKEAIGLLEMHRRMHPEEASVELFNKLLNLYVKTNDIDGVISVYKAMYERTPSDMLLQRLVQAYALKGDYRGAAAFLERHPDADPVLLYKLFKSMKRFDKAQAQAKRLYVRTKSPKWLAEEAIMLYEGAKDKKDQAMLRKMAELFERALAEGVDDSLYLNYYAYTLIDNDMDVKKGIALMKRALRQQPANAYYLDSLAWGYYKLGECDKAYEIMQKVVLQSGLSQPEIAEHWKKIRACAHKASAAKARH